MLTLQVPDDLALPYEDLARAAGRYKVDCILDPLSAYLEDIEDARIVSERLANPGRRVSLDQVKETLAWTMEFDERAEKDLSRLDKPVQWLIWRYLRERMAPLDDPTVFGKELHHEYAGVWRYRVGRLPHLVPPRE